MSLLLLTICCVLTSGTWRSVAADGVFDQAVQESIMDLAGKTSADILADLQEDDSEGFFNGANLHAPLAELLTLELAALTADLGPSLGSSWWHHKKWFNGQKCKDNKAACCSCRVCFSKCHKCKNTSRRCCCRGWFCDANHCKVANGTKEQTKSVQDQRFDDTLKTWGVSAKTHLRQVVTSFVMEQTEDGIRFCCKCKRCSRKCSRCGKKCCCKGNGGCRCKSCRSRHPTDMLMFDSIDQPAVMARYLDKRLDAIENMVDYMLADI